MLVINLKRNCNIFIELLAREVHVMKHAFQGSMINSLIWMTISLIVNALILPSMGMPTGYGPFFYVSSLASQMIFQAMTDSFDIIMDIQGAREINYFLQLPIPAWLMLFRFVVVTGIKGIVLGAISLPVAYLLLGNQFLFPHICWYQVVIMVVLQAFVWGWYRVWVSTFASHTGAYENIWMRITFPLWFLGCYLYPFERSLHSLGPIAYLSLLNPMTYAMEGARAAALGQEGSINFWICCAVLIVAGTGMSAHAYYRMKDKLDFV